MASGLGQVPLNLQQGNYGKAALNLAVPVTAGWLGGIGARSTGQFLNNIFNPAAGLINPASKWTKELVEGSVAAGKLKSPEFVKALRAEPLGFDPSKVAPHSSLNPTQQGYTGQWVQAASKKNLGAFDEMLAYLTGAEKKADGPMQLLAGELPWSQAKKISGANLPYDAKIMSFGAGKYGTLENAFNNGAINAREYVLLKNYNAHSSKIKNSPNLSDAMNKTVSRLRADPDLYNPNEILSASLSSKLRASPVATGNSNKVVEAVEAIKSDALDGIFKKPLLRAAKNNLKNSIVNQEMSYAQKNGGMIKRKDGGFFSTSTTGVPYQDKEYMYQEGGENLIDKYYKSSNYPYRIKDDAKRNQQIKDLLFRDLDNIPREYLTDENVAGIHNAFRSKYKAYGSDRGYDIGELYPGFDYKDYDQEMLDNLTQEYLEKRYSDESEIEEKRKGGEMIRRKDGSYSRRGLWDNIRENRGSGKKPTREMLEQERKIKNEYQIGGSVYDKETENLINSVTQMLSQGEDPEAIGSALVDNGYDHEIANAILEEAMATLEDYGDYEEEDINDFDDINVLRNGGIPDRYKNQGFTKVGAKRKSTRPGKKWMVLAKKGDKYKVVHGGYKGMKDYTQHGSEKRRERFWSRMGGKDSSKAKDQFSPLYWHKRFGTWAEGGNTPIEDPEGQRKHPGKTTRIPSNRITMKDIKYPVLAIGDNGKANLMLPGEEYLYLGVNYVDEVPFSR
jgi:hypothetical protein